VLPGSPCLRYDFSKHSPPDTRLRIDAIRIWRYYYCRRRADFWTIFKRWQVQFENQRAWTLYLHCVYYFILPSFKKSLTQSSYVATRYFSHRYCGGLCVPGVPAATRGAEKKRAVICPASHSSRLPPAPAVLSFPRTRESRKQKITRLNGYRTSARGACLLLLGYSLLLFPPARVEKLTSFDYPRKIKNGKYGTIPHAVLSSRRYRCWARKSERANRTGSTS